MNKYVWLYNTGTSLKVHGYVPSDSRLVIPYIIGTNILKKNSIFAGKIAKKQADEVNVYIS
jgi:hypothetical protein